VNRRTFNKLAGLAVFGATTEAASAQAPFKNPAPTNTSSGKELILQDAHILIAFDTGSGAITRLERKSSNWKIARRPELGVSFRLLAPLSKRRTNFILGQRQSAARVEKIGHNKIELEWKDPVSDHGGIVPLTFSATVTLEDGQLTFASTLTNRSTLTIETVDYPYFGEVNAPTPGESLEAETLWYGNLTSTRLSPTIGNPGYWGTDNPTVSQPSHSSLFCLIQANTQGLYVEMHDPTQPYLIEYTFEQHPGQEDSLTDFIPTQPEISGLPVYLAFRTCHFLFAHPQTTTKLAPIVVRGYDGDWHAGVDFYKSWRSTWFKKPHLAAWAQDIHSWLQLQIDGAEQDFTIPYRDLPKHIDECAANGVTAIQLVGWAIGGQDGGDPSMSTDPGLGTWQELHDAIAYARGKGVKIILFGKPIWADLTTDFYKHELYKYAAADPYGIDYETGGFSYTTPTQLAGINKRRRAIMDVQSPAYRDVATKEFKKMVDLGAAGWLFDEVCHHGGVDYAFNIDHGYKAPAYIYGGDMPMAAQFHSVSDPVDPDFVFAGEWPEDWLRQYYPVSYFRINRASRAVDRYIDSQSALMVAVSGFNDRDMLNMVLANRYIISYEPFNFKGHLSDFPLTLSYGKQIDALRHRYRDFLWDSEFRDTLGANISANGQYRHSVFLNKTGKRAVVVINIERGRTINATLQLPNPGTLVVVSPEQPDAQPSNGQVSIPARSVVVLMEQ